MLYTLLIYAPHPGDEPPSSAGNRAILDDHRALQARTRAAGTLRGCVRLAGLEQARTVRRQDGAPLVTDGPFAETKEWLAGFYLIECADEAEAVAHADALCGLPGQRIELRPVHWQMEPADG